MRYLPLLALLATSAAAAAEEAVPLSDLLAATHVHGIGPGPDGPSTLTLATHNGLWSVDLDAAQAARIGGSKDDFMGYSAVAGSPGQAFASGHPATGGNIGVIRTDDGGQTWTHVSDGLGGPVDFHNMEVSRADPASIYGVGHDGAVQHSTDSGLTWAATGQAPEKLIDIATSATDPATIYAATELGLFSSPDRGATWSALASGAPVSTVDAGADGKVRAVDLGQGLVAFDAAGQMTKITADLPDGYLLYLTATSTNPLRLAALSAKGRLVLSDDGGATWIDALDVSK